MSKNILRTAAIGLGGLILAGTAWTAVAAGPDQTPGRQGTPSATATATSTLSTATAADLAFSRDEEKMARDLYAAIAAQYGDALPFANIVNSEQRHFDAVGVLLDRYGLADPSAGLAAGKFTDAEIQKLYDTLLARSKTSLAEAYQVGIAVENRDIADVKQGLDDASQADVDRVFTNLLRGSEMHLSAFTDAANGVLGDHTGMGPNSDTARGNARGNGAGMGAGMGPRAGAGGGMGNGVGDGTCVNG